jgi:hypothetical protein
VPGQESKRGKTRSKWKDSCRARCW